MQATHPSEDIPYLHRLMHRWLVEYNPLYLLSAALVLGGVILCSHELALTGRVTGQVGVAAIAEVYAWALIGGAALLNRIQLRRPAVLLGLLAATYQGDLTLHTETCAYLGVIGVTASVVWLASFIAKLHALAWALQLRPSRTALLIPTAAALGLSMIPFAFHRVDITTTTQLTTLWIFTLGAFALWTHRGVVPTSQLDTAQRSKAEHCMRAVWLIWATLLAGHLAFWASESRIQLLPVTLVVPLLATRWLRREVHVWLITAATPVATAIAAPQLTSVMAMLSAATLLLHAFRRPMRVSTMVDPAPTGPYRTTPLDAEARIHSIAFAPAPIHTRLRFLAGSVTALYAAAWMWGWTEGPWPAHVLWLDTLFTIALAYLAIRRRAYCASVPAAATWAHWCIQRGWLALPATVLGWGSLSVGAGFALLAVSLGASWRMRRHAASSDTA